MKKIILALLLANLTGQPVHAGAPVCIRLRRCALACASAAHLCATFQPNLIPDGWTIAISLPLGYRLCAACSNCRERYAFIA